MSYDADTIVDRRRMRRKLTVWRVLAVVLAICAVVAIAAAMRAPGVGGFGGIAGGSIARVTISGLIRTDRQRVEALDRLSQSQAKAVIVHINSPGGTTSGSEELHDSITRLRAQKPTVIVVDGLAASGGYIAALGGDHIVAQETSLVGSIGVLFQYPNFTELLKTIGVSVETIKSSPLKAAPSGFEPTSPEAVKAVEEIVMDSYAWFKALVQKRRNLDDATLAKVADGRVFTGRQGLALKLIDQLGDEKTAVDWLAKQYPCEPKLLADAAKCIDPKTPVRDFRLRDRFSDLPFLHTAAIATLNALGFGTFARHIEELGAVQAIERLNLDGLLALWHPPTGN